MGKLKNILFCIIVFCFGLVFLVLLCCMRTFILINFATKPLKAFQLNKPEVFKVDDESWSHLKKSITFKTVSIAPGDYDTKELKNFQRYILES